MRELPIVLDGTRVAVIGYGRIGEILSAKLKLLGAYVTVYARRREVCVRAELMGHTSKLISTEEILTFDTSTRVIFNTVPKRLFDRAVLEKLSKECLIIDLASAPGGVDSITAGELGIRAIWATALPGKCAPESAGIILGETAHSILQDTPWRS
jgi:dipicolinate synthase subunit A